MAKKISPLLPSTEALLHQFSDRLRMARQRRRLSAKQVAERAGMSPMTLRSLERGGSGATMGAYLAVMQVLGIETDLDLLGKADPQGRVLQDARLPAAGKKAARPEPVKGLSPALASQFSPPPNATAQLRQVMENSPVAQLRKVIEAQPEARIRKAIDALPSERLRAMRETLEAPAKIIKQLQKATLAETDSAKNWRKQSGFIDSETLAGLIHPVEHLSKPLKTGR
jgi:transcriptional regulator with XRE-family HTH domain